MERLFDGKVYLEVWVKVKSGWNDDERLLKSLGYEKPAWGSSATRWTVSRPSCCTAIPSANQPDRRSLHPRLRAHGAARPRRAPAARRHPRPAARLPAAGNRLGGKGEGLTLMKAEWVGGQPLLAGEALSAATT
jgi:hypothetical protein